MIRKLFLGRNLWATLIILAGVAFLCRLGFWQLERHEQRRALNAQIVAGMALPPTTLREPLPSIDELDYRHVAVRGVFDTEHEILLRNRSLNGATGYHLITPLRLSGSDAAVLIDRGWIPLTESDPQSRAIFAPPAGELQLVGIARRSQAGSGGPQDPPFSAERPRLDAWFRIDIERIQQQTPYRLLPVFIQLQPDEGAPTTLPQPVATTDLGMGSHLGYAIQWFSFAVIFLVGYIIFMQRRSPSP
jgi:surfeit locus 1 family protein